MLVIPNYTQIAPHVSTGRAPFLIFWLPLSSAPATCCYLFIYVHFFFCFFFFPQTLHIYCAHTSHIASASYSSSGSHGLYHGEFLSPDIHGCSFQLVLIHVCRKKKQTRYSMWQSEDSIIALLASGSRKQHTGTLQFDCHYACILLGTLAEVFLICWHSCSDCGGMTRKCSTHSGRPDSPRWQTFRKSDPVVKQFSC